MLADFGETSYSMLLTILANESG